MRSFFYLFLLFSTFSGIAQNFTNGSVYDFSVGDTIVSSYQAYKRNNADGPPTYNYMMITGKIYSPNLDTITYLTHNVHFTPVGCMNCSVVITADDGAFFVTDLNSSVINYTFSLGVCRIQKDTSYVGFCGFNEHVKYVADKPGFTCYEAPRIKDTYIEGIGKFILDQHLNGIPTEYGYETKLISAHKVGKNCSIIGQIPNGISEFSRRNGDLKVYPSVSNGEFIIETEKDGILSISNALGQEVYRREVSEGKNNIELSLQPEGIYFIHFQMDGFFLSRKIIKN